MKSICKHAYAMILNKNQFKLQLECSIHDGRKLKKKIPNYFDRTRDERIDIIGCNFREVDFLLSKQ